ncbi:Sterol desaturase/sphingolipid hydroxylase, fatty acid hydroxylase superfamily [Flavobacterium swingsii]|jgi:sterol desaturase/sphingolipid hydroxylase (fatty acid hydroxylase superfamily)|uniref:Sterol desaturase/sphingolipid hydroxylase, fatty acid hydroxylase superfamily n=1 Tax=Flavobacterium swingsii TaxID=498292 RepID=A0A1I0VEF7_9FLAO|nr:sterol desaturase family protein [Flavobacterium swingsii]SFA74427.1 Sterol desaturase/sphingolipid hydroxylase, fatty acid hydroxylase superfamily [Flavobacterium swingsii]
MNEIVAYFENIPSSHRSFIIVGGITLFWIIENGFPLFKFKYNKWQHASINIFFTLTTIVVNFSLAIILYKSSIWVTENNFGVLHWLSIKSLLLQAIIGLLLMDLIGAYTAHFVQHKMKILWRFHLIHHTDTWIDTTSANRHHPGESVIRFLFTTLAIIIVGAPIWLFFLYQSLSVFLSQFNHANLNLPEKLDNYISYFIVSPNMHKVHHHYILPYTDSNYGNIFSVWDRLFGTFLILPMSEIIYGVDTHMNPEEHNKLSSLLKIPFKSSQTFVSELKK